MSKNLVIVESPAKAKTIQKFLGKDFEVKSSFGHVRDLPGKGMNIDIPNNFEPNYEVNADKKKVVAELRRAAKNADLVWLASDEDREGEAISWHLSELLKLKESTRRRIVFHEITESAIKNAVANPRDINLDLVDAQQARRVLDRIVGYELSPMLQRKITRGLSAGRVQSVAVRLVVEREKEIDDFKAEQFYRIKLQLKAGGEEFEAVLAKKIKTIEEAKKILEDIASGAVTVGAVTQKPGKKSPPVPFTTSSLQQAASQTLGMSPRNTMSNAQRLYEAGLITYMRTDSLNLSETAITAIEKLVSSKYGKEYLNVTRYKTKSSGAQEAHEAIRPTDFSKDMAGADEYQKKLYSLIWRRTVASQMAPAKLEKTTITFKSKNSSEIFESKGEVLAFEGFIKAYGRSGNDSILPNLTVGDEADIKTGEAHLSFGKKPGRFTEASLIKKLEELGIGRPSTYAPTLSTIEARGYIEKADKEGVAQEVRYILLEKSKVSEKDETITIGADRGKLIPTDTGIVVTDFLLKNIPDIMDYQFTADMEAKFDEVAEGKHKWQKVIADFYGKFHDDVTKLSDVKRSDVGQRILGEDPKTKKPVIARIGRFGPMLQIGTVEDEDKPAFANMPAGRQIADVTLEEALEMFKLPKTLGEYKGEEVKVNIGRFGPYLMHDGKFISIKGIDMHAITLEEAIPLVAENIEKEKNKYVADWGNVQIINGPYGPYIKDVKAKKNAKIPKDVEPKDITEEQAIEILAKAPTKKARGRRFPAKKK
jgi:DNA topoisomerase-1